MGAAVAVPLCLLLGLCGFSRVLTGIVVALGVTAVCASSLLSESAKKLCCIFIVWDVLVPTVHPVSGP
jgi:hypothetical protein